MLLDGNREEMNKVVLNHLLMDREEYFRYTQESGLVKLLRLVYGARIGGSGGCRIK